MNALSILVLTSLIGAAYCTICKQCWVMDSTECWHETDKICPGTQCITYTTRDEIENKTYVSIKKTCGDSSICDTCISVTTNSGVNYRISTQCGTGNCSNANLNFNMTCEKQLKANDYWCPKCHKPNSLDGCVPNGKVRCGGNELECLDYRGTVEFSNGDIKNMSSQGCVTKGACLVGFGLTPGMKELKAVKMSCTPAEKIPNLE